MATKRNRLTSDALQLRLESGKFVLADGIASKIRNMIPTDEGTLRSIQGPCLYLPAYSGFPAPVNGDKIARVNDHRLLEARTRGIYHAINRVFNRDMLLLESGKTIWEFRGWKHGWYPLIGDSAGTIFPPSPGPGGDGAQVSAKLINTTRPQFPTQFETTDQGVIIVPQGGASRAYFYDGKYAGPLGYTTTPGPPTGHGPRSHLDYVTFARLFRGGLDWSTITSPPVESWPDRYVYGEELPLDKNVDNNVGEGDPELNNLDYAHDAQTGFRTAMHPDFGVCRVGTIETNPGDVGIQGILLDCRYRAAVQWIDRWGNLSPVSGRSNDVYTTEQPSFTYGVYDGVSNLPEGTEVPEHEISPGKVDLVLKQIAWSSIEAGPEGTIGRILCRTKDLEHSGTADFFTMRSYAAEGGSNFASIPDNSTTLFPDNVPDSWLFIPVREPIPVPVFKLTRLAFGRHFIGNLQGEEGLVRWSMPNRWGTFLEDDFVFPDATGEAVTGLWRAAEGLLVFTAVSTFMLEPSSSGDTYVTRTVSATVGCAAPSSIATLETGETVWLSRGGFYLYDGDSIELISEPINRTINTLNQTRLLQSCAAIEPHSGEYRCWVPQYGSKENNLCLIFDGNGWRERTDVSALAVCVTQDHRKYMIAVGPTLGSVVGLPAPQQPDYSVFVVDVENKAYRAVREEAIIETAWLSGLTRRERSTALTVYFWLRETKSKLAVPDDENNQSQGILTVEVARDWRETTIETTTTELVPPDDVPPLYNETVLGSGSSWVRRRPYWVRAMIYVPSCEVFKLRIKNKGDWEFIGLVFDEQPKQSGGARIPISTP